MITRTQAIALTSGTTLYHMTYKNADGSPQRWRVNGKPQTWKRDPSRFRVPVKHGLRSYDALETASDLKSVSLHEGVAAGKCRDIGFRTDTAARQRTFLFITATAEAWLLENHRGLYETKLNGRTLVIDLASGADLLVEMEEAGLVCGHEPFEATKARTSEAYRNLFEKHHKMLWAMSDEAFNAEVASVICHPKQYKPHEMEATVVEYRNRYGAVSQTLASVAQTDEFSRIPGKLPKPLSLAEVKRLITNPIHMTINRTTSGEWRVNFRNGNEESAYYSNDRTDAVQTARVMAKAKADRLAGTTVEPKSPVGSFNNPIRVNLDTTPDGRPTYKSEADVVPVIVDNDPARASDPEAPFVIRYRGKPGYMDVYFKVREKAKTLVGCLSEAFQFRILANAHDTADLHPVADDNHLQADVVSVDNIGAVCRRNPVPVPAVRFVHIDDYYTDFRTRMAEIVKYAEKTAPGNDHRETCIRTATAYRLFDKTADGESFPVWLSRLVAGVYTDLGLNTDDGLKNG